MLNVAFLNDLASHSVVLCGVVWCCVVLCCVVMEGGERGSVLVVNESEGGRVSVVPCGGGSGVKCMVEGGE